MYSDFNISCVPERIIQFILNNKLPNVKVKKNTFPLDNRLKKLDDSNFIDTFKNSSIDEFVNIIIDESHFYNREMEAIVIIDNVEYLFKRHAAYQNISIYKFKKYDFSALPEKYNEKVDINEDLFVNNYKEVTNIVNRNDFFVKKLNYDIIDFLIFSNHMNSYFSDDFLDLINIFSYIFTKKEHKIIKSIYNKGFKKAIIPSTNKELKSMFKNWYNFLCEQGATKENPYIFNDHDNFAYADSNEHYEMITQRSQNTFYTYIKEKSTTHIRIWNTAYIPTDSKFLTDFVSDSVKEGKSYIEAFKSIMNTSSYDIYFINLDHLNSYLKSPEFYFNNFDSDEFIIYDNKKGCSIKSMHSFNLMNDFSLLDSVLTSIKNLEYEDD